SAISDQRSAISDQRSAISDQRSAISDQRSAISDQRSDKTIIFPVLRLHGGASFSSLVPAQATS
ncbi:MAG: hypothetical protein WBG54_13210, partial [Acidobacteriaceae bacterium]